MGFGRHASDSASLPSKASFMHACRRCNCRIVFLSVTRGITSLSLYRLGGRGAYDRGGCSQKVNGGVPACEKWAMSKSCLCMGTSERREKERRLLDGHTTSGTPSAFPACLRSCSDTPCAESDMSLPMHTFPPRTNRGSRHCSTACAAEACRAVSRTRGRLGFEG